MSAFTKQFGDVLIEYLLDSGSLTQPTTLYVALHDNGTTTAGDPGDDAQDCFDTELDYTSYERQEITFSANATGTTDSTKTNDNAPQFPAVDATEGGFHVTGVSIWDAPKGANLGASGNCLFKGAISAAKELADSDAIVVPAGNITITLD